MLYENENSLKVKFIDITNMYATYKQWQAQTKAAVSRCNGLLSNTPKNNDTINTTDPIIVVNQPIVFINTPPCIIRYDDHCLITGPNGSGKSSFFDLLMKRMNQHRSIERNTVLLSNTDLLDVNDTNSFI